MEDLEDIKNSAVRIEERLVFTQYDYAEIQAKRKDFTDVSIELAKELDNLATVGAEYKVRIKELKSEATELLKEIKLEGVEENITCYLVPNQEDGKMEFYDKDGEIRHSRSLYPNERQLNFIAAKREESNG